MGRGVNVIATSVWMIFKGRGLGCGLRSDKVRGLDLKASRVRVNVRLVRYGLDSGTSYGEPVRLLLRLMLGGCHSTSRILTIMSRTPTLTLTLTVTQNLTSPTPNPNPSPNPNQDANPNPNANLCSCRSTSRTLSTTRRLCSHPYTSTRAPQRD